MAENAAASGRLVCFGELLARLSTQDYLPLADASALNLHFAGAEANVAVQFSALGGGSGSGFTRARKPTGRDAS